MISNPTLPTSLVVVVVTGVVLYVIWTYYKKPLTAVPLPPGPKPLPIIGNIHQLSEEAQEKTFHSWGHRYGGMVYVKVLNKAILAINSFDIARDLMEKRGAIYSDRPRMVLLNEVLGVEGNVAFLRYGDRFRRGRKWVHDAFTSTALASYRSRQRREVNVLLKGVLTRPTAFTAHIARFTQSLILDITYGHLVNSDDDHYIELGNNGSHAFADVGSAGSNLVDFFPILKHYPTWLPGSAWKRRTLKAAVLVKAMHDVPYNMVRDQLRSGSARPSFTATRLEEYYHAQGHEDLSADDERDLKAAAATLYSAGTETMEGTMHTFALAMLLHPDVFRKAQEEMDRVVGSSRLPELDDRANLPYLNAVIKETFRWHPPVPLGIPHRVDRDDIYAGYRIPKGTTIIGNAWGMSRDEDQYPDPEIFMPGRFLKPNQPTDPREYIFGFGRRLCPGKDFADSCIYLVLANIIATMYILKEKGADGEEITPEPLFTAGFASRPEPFGCVLKPRSHQAFNLILQQDTDSASFTAS